MLIDHSVFGLAADERGVTIAEILVATIVISVGLVGLAMVIPLSSYGVHEGNALSTATFLAEQRLEEVRNAVWTCPGSGDSPCPVAAPPANDCLGLSVDGAGDPLGTRAPFAPSTLSTTGCTRAVPTGATCAGSCDPTYSDENPVSGYPAYRRTVRIYPCDKILPGAASAGCSGVTSASMRLVRVTVTYTPMSGAGGQGTGTGKSAVLEMIIARRQ